MVDESSPRPIDSLEALEVYAPPQPAGPTDLDLSSNEGSEPPQTVIDALCALDVDEVRRYPTLSKLRGVIAEYHGVADERVLVTAGGDQALDVLCRTYLDTERTLVTHRPTFEMIGRYPRILGADVTEVDWRRSPFPVDEFIEAVQAPTDIAVIVTPNNPTGATVTPDQFETIVEVISPSLLVIDHAYVEFTNDDLTRRSLEYDNAVVIRTFSKALGLAGLRVGYALGPAEVISKLRRVRNPYPLSTPAIEAATARLEGDLEDVDRFITSIRSQRDDLMATLETLGLRPYPSEANFILVESHPRWLFDGLAGLGIKVRLFPRRPTIDEHLRITLPGSHRAFERLERAIRTTVDPQTVLFDMDGVIADVRESYRRAVIDTADAFSVTVTHEDINEMKAAGDANDDWELTHELIEDAGINIDFETVKQAFEDRYNGCGDFEPLYRHERPLVGDGFATLAQKIPLGIVTGRPHRDAHRFLEDHALSTYFDVVVCKEDAPHKPNPTPVEMALEQLGCERGWLLGDTPDDIVAARRAGVLPLGVVPPGVDAEAHTDTLLNSGAARVFNADETLIDQLVSQLRSLNMA